MTNQEKEKRFIFDSYLFTHESSFDSHDSISKTNFHGSVDVFFYISADIFFDDVKIISEMSSESNCASEIETEISREEFILISLKDK